MSSSLQNLIALFGIVVLGVVGYFIYVQNSNVLESTTTSTSNEASLEAAQFLARLNELKLLRLDDSLFNDPRFRSLRDVRVPVVPTAIGRSNPFAVPN
jgi:hypothetical protein